MGLSISTARWVAPASFTIDFLAQQYGMFSKPSMLDIHNAHLSFFSPQPFFIAGFFFPQQIAQVVWLYRLWKLDESKPEQRRELETQVDFVPYYAFGNICIASWMIFWNSEQLLVSHAFVTANTLSQLFYVATKLGKMDTSSWSSILTHVVSKTFAGIGVLDLLHNGSVAFFDGQQANGLVKVLTGLGFGAASMFSDWIFGGCLVYDLIALAVGQSQTGEGDWSKLLGFYAVGSAAIVAAANRLKA